MPRLPRIDIPDTVYHVYNRGHNKTAIFLDEQDRYTFLKYLKRAHEQCPWELLGYCLMENHYHLQVKTLKEPLAKTMHYLDTLYAEYFNYKYNKVGHVFQNRYHSIPVEVDSYLLVLSRYIHLNPVAAGLVLRPENYAWSSYREYLGLTSSGLIQPELVINTLSDDPARQRLVYARFVEDGMNKPPQFTENAILKTRIFGGSDFAWSLRSLQPSAFPISASERVEYAI